jgi:hypothetical protein
LAKDTKQALRFNETEITTDVVKQIYEKAVDLLCN